MLLFVLLQNIQLRLNFSKNFVDGTYIKLIHLLPNLCSLIHCFVQCTCIELTSDSTNIRYQIVDLSAVDSFDEIPAFSGSVFTVKPKGGSHFELDG